MSETNMTMAANVSAGPQAVEPVRRQAASQDSVERADKAQQQEVTSSRKALGTDEPLEQAVQTIKDHAGMLDQDYRLRVDEETRRVIAQIVDAETDEVVRQYPREEVLRIAQHLQEFIGLLFDTEA